MMVKYMCVLAVGFLLLMLLMMLLMLSLMLRLQLCNRRSPVTSCHNFRFLLLLVQPPPRFPQRKFIYVVCAVCWFVPEQQSCEMGGGVGGGKGGGAYLMLPIIASADEACVNLKFGMV
jgi:hypothetical protein